MHSIQLSKDADKLLCTIYKKYLERRKQNLDKSTASNFTLHDICSLLPTTNEDDISTDLHELSKKQIVKLYMDYEIVLTSDGIVYMENRFKNGLNEVTDFISKFIP